MASSILPPASKKENMERKETQRSILQIAIYIREKKMERNTKNFLSNHERGSDG